MQKLSYPCLWDWILTNSTRVTFDTQLELFGLLFAAFVAGEDKHYTASQISRYGAGREHLPRKMVSRYWLAEDYIADLQEAVLTVLIPCFADLPGAIDQLVCVIDGDNTLTRRQRDKLLEGCNADGGEATAAWLAYILRFAMLVRADGGSKAA